MPIGYDDSIRSALDAFDQAQRLRYRSLADELEYTARSFAFPNPLDELQRHAAESLAPTLTDASTLAQVARGTGFPALQQEISAVAYGPLPSASAFDAMQSSVLNMVERDRGLSELAKGAAAHMADHDFQLAQSAALSVMQGMTAYSAFKDQIGQLTLAATALEPLQHLSASLAETLGASASLQNVRDALSAYRAADFEPLWVDPFQSLAAFAADAMYTEFEDERDSEPSDESAEAATLENDNVLREEARRVAMHFAVSWFKPSLLLKQLAKRIDPLVADDAWDRQILLIACEFPEHAVALTRLAIPLLQRLAWPTARSGTRADGSAERLTDDDAKAFAEIAHAMSSLLTEIEKSAF
jgi:hypothetical protein